MKLTRRQPRLSARYTLEPMADLMACCLLRSTSQPNLVSHRFMYESNIRKSSVGVRATNIYRRKILKF
jgi:hypothetical protein